MNPYTNNDAFRSLQERYDYRSDEPRHPRNPWEPDNPHMEGTEFMDWFMRVHPLRRAMGEFEEEKE